MAGLKPTEIIGEVVYLGVNPDREAGLESGGVESADVGFEGLIGEAHGGLTRPSCSRVLKQYPRGTEIKNARQATILSAEELAEIGADMGLPEAVRPEWIGANIVLSGIPMLTKLPPASRLIFENEGPSFVVDLENGPCRFPGDVIETVHPGLGRHFAKQAKGRRGVVAWVERPGALSLGARCRLHAPDQAPYPPLAG